MSARYLHKGVTACFDLAVVLTNVGLQTLVIFYWLADLWVAAWHSSLSCTQVCPTLLSLQAVAVYLWYQHLVTLMAPVHSS
jgi:hypothetical protein